MNSEWIKKKAWQKNLKVLLLQSRCIVIQKFRFFFGVETEGELAGSLTSERTTQKLLENHLLFVVTLDPLPFNKVKTNFLAIFW